MVECPSCGTDNAVPASSWTGGAKTSKPMAVQRFLCRKCGAKYVAWTDSKTGKTRVMTRGE